MTNPCDKCKRKPNCPERCYPKLDYERAVRKRRRTMDKIKPCPFCGGKPYVAQNYLGQKYVRCTECGACVWGKDADDWRISAMGEKNAEKAAIEAWNRRTANDPR